ncbi:DUF2975 domain-containing protein [Lacticaseibacillus absianus]|uniref:DUF2975 domain-containing protein n=1 Tax=Lacticaseibacillus absianus TaxID=2729623 RepID=UPI0015CD3F9D|nr:DUF2975 domain-containing protein [Lacticaseibacillus absianus]
MAISQRTMALMATFIKVMLQLSLLIVLLSGLLTLFGRIGVNQVILPGHTYVDVALAQPTVSHSIEGFSAGALPESATLIGPVSLGAQVILIADQLLVRLVVAVMLWLGARFFAAIATAAVFTTINARRLLWLGYCGLGLTLYHELISPYLIRWLLTTFTPTQLTGGIDLAPFTGLALSCAALVMGYVFAYGVQLQHETEGLV